MSLQTVCGAGLAAVAAAATAFAAAPTAAQTLGIGSTKAGAVAQTTATISKVVSESGTGLQMRSQTMGGTQQYIPVVNAGEMGFGISNLPQYWMAKTGTGLSEGNKYENLRLIATMMEFSVGWVVTKNSGIKSPKDFKGKRLGHGFKAAPLFQYIQDGGLASVGMTFADVVKVPAVGLSQHWNMFMEGKIDAVIVNAGTGIVKQMNAKISGGVHHISYPNTAEALKGMHRYFPKSQWKVVEPGKGLDSIDAPTNLINYDYMLWTHKGLPDDVAYKIAKIMHTQAAKLKEGGPLWRTYKADARLCLDHDTEYHPGAVKYYKEAGLCASM
jgi:TRAP transporter TAXI family solute receptor